MDQTTLVHLTLEELTELVGHSAQALMNKPDDIDLTVNQIHLWHNLKTGVLKLDAALTAAIQAEMDFTDD